MKLVVGAERLDRTLDNAERLLDDFFAKDLGRDYYAYTPITPQTVSIQRIWVLH